MKIKAINYINTEKTKANAIWNQYDLEFTVLIDKVELFFPKIAS